MAVILQTTFPWNYDFFIWIQISPSSSSSPEHSDRGNSRSIIPSQAPTCLFHFVSKIDCTMNSILCHLWTRCKGFSLSFCMKVAQLFRALCSDIYLLFHYDIIFSNIVWLKKAMANFYVANFVNSILSAEASWGGIYMWHVMLFHF